MKELPQVWIAVYAASIAAGKPTYYACSDADTAMKQFIERFKVDSTGQTSLKLPE